VTAAECRAATISESGEWRLSQTLRGTIAGLVARASSEIAGLVARASSEIAGLVARASSEIAGLDLEESRVQRGKNSRGERERERRICEIKFRVKNRECRKHFFIYR
jgi:hypothetical protein